MMKTNSSQARMQAKARAAMEPGLGKTTPQVAVKKSNEMRERAMIAKERPIGLRSGGPVRHYADGGSVKKRDEREVIEFSGKELDDMMGGASHPTKIKGKGMRGAAAAEAFVNQSRKGKSKEASDDASDVMRGFGWDKDTLGPNYDYDEKTTNKAKGGAVKKSDAKQDKALMSRHNRLMHPGQKPKMAGGGMAKMAAGGAAKVRKGVATPKGAPKPQPRSKNPAYR